MNDREFEVWQDDMCVAGTMGSNALNEIKHYAAQYEQDGPIEVYEVTRTLIDLQVASQQPKEAMSDAEIIGLFADHKDGERCYVIFPDEVIPLARVIEARSGVNAQLVEALKDCLALLERDCPIELPFGPEICKARAALAAAGVEVK